MNKNIIAKPSEDKELQALSDSILARISGGLGEKGINYGVCPYCGSTHFYPVSSDIAKEWIRYQCLNCRKEWEVDEEGIHTF